MLLERATGSDLGMVNPHSGSQIGPSLGLFVNSFFGCYA